MTTWRFRIRRIEKGFPERGGAVMYAAIRVLLIAVSLGSVVAWYFSNEDYAAIRDAQLLTKDIYWLTICLLLAGVVAWAAIVVRCRVSNERATLPAWHSNPFNFRQPASFFHMLKWMLVAYGLADLIAAWVLYGVTSRFGAMGLAAGIGMGIGIKLALGNASIDRSPIDRI